MSLQHLSSDLLSNIARATNDPTAALDLETAVGSSVFTDQERSTLLAEQMEQRMEQGLSHYFHAVIELCGALSGAESVEHAVVPRWASDFHGRVVLDVPGKLLAESTSMAREQGVGTSRWRVS